MTLYKGNAKIQDTGFYGVFVGNRPIGAIYKGNERLYMFTRTLSWDAGTTLAEYKVPVWIKKIRVDCVASKGYYNPSNSDGVGFGGRVQCDLTVTGGQTLYITVGNVPTSAHQGVYNASDIRTNNSGVTNEISLQSRLLVAGGGGGNADTWGKGKGGNGGGLEGARGGNWTNLGYGGYGGTQSAGGSAGSGGGYGAASGEAGKFGMGGQRNGGDGGAGWYGGGSGGVGSYGNSASGGGGGGSSYTDETLCSDVTHTQGYQDGAGYITIEEIA